MRGQPMKSSERGSAMILSLIIVMALSVIGASLTVLSLSETYGSMNYRLMSQARYGAESGVHKVAHYLLNTYVAPGGVGDPLTAYDITKSPVKYNGADVVLSTIPGVTSNYPLGSVVSNFQSAAAGSLVTGNANIQYTGTATLLSMRQILAYGSTTPITIQTWQITADGTTTGARGAQVEVTATLERQTVSLYPFAVFATSATCGALQFAGGAVVDSYDSSNIIVQGSNVVTQQYGGNIGSNGNLNESGNPTTVWGTMSTPRTGVGGCSSNGVDAWTINGNASVSGGLVQLPQALTYPTPPAPNPMPPTTSLSLDQNSTCAGISGCTMHAAPNAGPILAPGSYGNVDLTAHAKVHFTTGTYTINSMSMQGNAEIFIDSGPVIFNVAGAGVTTPLDLVGGSVTNSTLNPSMLQIQYAGTGAVKVAGGSATSGMVYAPNAPVTLAGGSDWYGAIIAATVQDTGGMHVHNDRQLANEFFSVGNYMLSAFSWKKS